MTCAAPCWTEQPGKRRLTGRCMDRHRPEVDSGYFEAVRRNALRTVDAALLAQRLRNESFFCRRLGLEINWSDKSSHHAECRFEQTQDTHLLLNSLMDLWNKLPEGRPWRVGVGLRELIPASEHQPSLFGSEARPELTQALDRVNQRFGIGSVSFGASASPKTSKIAFRRVPKLEEM